MSGRKRCAKSIKTGTYIVGEGITEQYYFSHLKVLKKSNCFIKPRLFRNTSIDEMEKSADQLLLGGVSVICVFDADVSQRNIKEKKKLADFKKKYRNNKNVLICDSFPSIEYWFLLHFLNSCKYYQSSKSVEKELQKFIKDYRKNRRFLEQVRWVEDLLPRLDVAMKNAIKCPKGFSYSNIFKAISKISN